MNVVTPQYAFLQGFKDENLDGGLPIVLGYMEQFPKNDVIVLTEYGGLRDIQLPIQRPYFQICFFSMNYITAQQLCWNAYQTLWQKEFWIVNGWNMQKIFCQYPKELPPVNVTGGCMYGRALSVMLYMTKEN